MKFYVYEPKSGGGCGNVIGEFICDFAQSFSNGVTKEIVEALVVSKEFARSYFNNGKGYMIRINEPKRYDQPKQIGEFYKISQMCKDKDCANCNKTYVPIGYCDGIKLKRPPQSWCYVEEVEQ